MASLAPLLLGLGILNIIGTSANPLNQVLLSKVSMMLAEGRMAEARGYIGHLLAAAAELSFFVCIQSVVFADVAIRIWVGPAYSSEGLLIRILLMAIPFYLLHTALRCVIDAGAVTAYNTYNILIAFVVFIASVAVEVRMLPAALLLKSIAATLLLALAVLAWTTARVVKMVYNVRLRWRDSLPSFAFAGFLGCASLAYRYVEHFHTGAFEFMACEVLLNAAFLVFLNRRRCAWFKFVSGGIFRPPAPVPSGIATANTA
jgi:O-antigen/teichoic acid export membrane protein